MEISLRKRDLIKHLAIVLVLISLLPATTIHHPKLTPAAVSVPSPLLGHQHPVDWWFVFKLNASKFPDCGGAARACPFGGTVETYKVGQQYAFASSESPTLKQGAGCAGDTGSDPIGATFEQVYNGAFHYLIWNDQFYNDPQINGCPGTFFLPQPPVHFARHRCTLSTLTKKPASPAGFSYLKLRLTRLITLFLLRTSRPATSRSPQFSIQTPSSPNPA